MTSHVQDFDLKKPHKVEPMLRCLFQILCGDPRTYSEYIYGSSLRLKRIHSKIVKAALVRRL